MHQHYYAFSGCFDVRYFPELIYIPELQRYMNCWNEEIEVFSDKNNVARIADSIHVRTPRAFLTCQNGLIHDDQGNEIELQEAARRLYSLGNCFVKPTRDTSSGIGCSLCTFKDGKELFSNLDISDFLRLQGRDFVVQEKITCSKEIRAIYDGSVNTFRVMSYRWKDSIIIPAAIMRIGQGGNFLDNAHAGGIFISIDDDGILGERAYTEFKDEYLPHPDSAVTFMGYKIPGFESVLTSVKKMHEQFSRIGIIHWDFTLGENSTPVLIEANMKDGGIWFFQMASGKGVFGDKTDEILNWMRRMRKNSIENRKTYCFGY